MKYLLALCLIFAATSIINGKEKNKDRDRDDDRDDEEEMDEDFKNINGTDVKFVITARELPLINNKRGIQLLSSAQNEIIPEPYVELKYFEKLTSERSRTYTTTTLSATSNPEWPDVVKVKFILGQGQRITFTVFDKSGTEIAHATTNIKSIVTAPGNTLEVPLLGKIIKNGFLVIYSVINNAITEDTEQRLILKSDDVRPINLNSKKQKKKRNKNENRNNDD